MTRSGAARAQYSRKSMSLGGVGASSPSGRSINEPSARRSNCVANGSGVHFAPSRFISRLPEPERLDGVLFENQLVHLGLEARFAEILDPAIRRDQWIVGAEQHARLELRVGVLHELRRKILGRPAGQVD